jgi:allophanate hydrolase subunit 2
MFTTSVETFLTAEWKLSPVSDRMGMRLVGPPLEFHPRPPDRPATRARGLPTSSTT